MKGATMLLESKNAVIYGGGGNVGGAVARAFAREGAIVHLAGRTLAPMERVARDILDGGGTATIAQVDALDEAAVDTHTDAIARDHGTLDISMNLIATGDVQGTPLVEMALADFERPIHNAVRSTYITARAAARHMIPQRSGVILMFGGEGDPIRDYNIGGFQISLIAVEALRKQLASELGRHGIRAVSLLTGGVIDAIPAEFEGRDALVESLVASTLLGRGATLDDVGNVAAFAASDRARSITASAINISCGAIIT
jgi:NAD(P)-dependent dehydrogenase (short-subunit alcohol dehydrogenase family)